MYYISDARQEYSTSQDIIVCKLKFTSPGKGGAKYCDEYVLFVWCLSVCLSIRSHNSTSISANADGLRDAA